MSDTIYRKSITLVLTAGDYSDYSLHGVYRVLRNLNVSTVRAEYLEAIEAITKTMGDLEARRLRYNNYRFTEWLVSSGYLEVMNYEELNVDDLPA